jgi:hypothetical protein
MTSTCQLLKKGTRTGDGPRALFRLFHRVVWLTLLGLFVVCHGCHGDEDNELAATGLDRHADATPQVDSGAASPSFGSE